MDSDSNEEDEITAACLIIVLDKMNKSKQRRRRSCWVRPWIGRRLEFGAFHSLLEELKSEDTRSLKNFLRMDLESFEELLHMVEPLIIRQTTNMREPIEPGERLALTLRYLATGDSYQSLEYLYRVSKNAISAIIPETCEAIYGVLQESYLKVPQTAQEWELVAANFEDKWNFPNCISTLDGKHVSLRKPFHSGSQYYNYKGFYSIVLLALVDADYKFIFVDIGTNRRVGDAGIFANSPLSTALENGSLNLPAPKPLPNGKNDLPYVIVGDDAFPLKSNLLKPYPSRGLTVEKRVFNYRLSRARRVSENAFGIISSRFNVLQRPISLEPPKAENVVKAIVAIHNFLRCKSDRSYFYQDEYWGMEHQANMASLVQQGGNRNQADARNIRDEYCNYFNTDGQVQWQWSNV